MKLFGWLRKKPRATAKIPNPLTDEQVDDILHPDKPIYGQGLTTASMPLIPEVNRSVRKIPVQTPDDEPVPAPPQAAPQVSGSPDPDNARATMALAKRMYRESVNNVLLNKLNNLRSL